MLQVFLDVNGLSPLEIDHRAYLLEKLVECHNLHLDELNLDQITKEPIITLSKKCNLCDFSSHTTRGVNIHKSRKHEYKL